jgi:hypothetical protein
MKALSTLITFLAICGTMEAQTSWLLTGNGNTTTSHFLGTTNSTDLRFRTANSTRMTLRSTGQLGINVTPDTKYRLFANDNAPSGLMITNTIYSSARGQFNNGTGIMSANGYLGAYYSATFSTSGLPTSMNYAGVIGVKEDDAYRGAGILGWNRSNLAGGNNYGIYGLANGISGGIVGVNDKNIGIYGAASGNVTNIGIWGYGNGANDYAGYFTGRGYFSGRVGIGTENPSTLLHINGTGELLRLNASSPSFSLSVNNVAKGFMQASGNNVNIGLSTGNSSGNLYFYANNNARMTMLNNGNLGLGTTSPSAKLQIHSTTEAIGVRGTDGFIQFYNSSNVARSYIQGMANDLRIGTSTGNTSGDIIFAVNSGEAIRILDDKTVRIGTTTAAAGYKLAVGGKIICEEVKVRLQANWPDYVFADNYNLMPLEEVKQHIETEKHLPGMNSAAEMHEDGSYNLGEMQQKLLEKVEELTLYVIQLNEENKSLKAEVQSLRVAR